MMEKLLALFSSIPVVTQMALLAMLALGVVGFALYVLLKVATTHRQPRRWR